MAGGRAGEGGLRIQVAVHPASPVGGAFTEAAVRAAAARHPGALEGTELRFSDTGAALEAALPESDILLLAGQMPLEGLRERAPRLRWLHYTSAGVEWLLKAGLPPGLLLTNASGTHAPKTAEFALLSVLMLNNRIPRFTTAQREARWAPEPNSTVAGKTALVLGMGGLGAAAAGALRGAGLRVLGLSRSGRPHPAAEMHPIAALHALLPEAEFLLVTLPLTPETEGIIGPRELELLPAGAGVVNIGRGPLLDHAALVSKLRDGSLSGAVLDTVPEEPLPADSPLWSAPYIILTPHCGLYDPVSYGTRCLDGFFGNLLRFRRGEAMERVVEPGRGY